MNRGPGKIVIFVFVMILGLMASLMVTGIFPHHHLHAEMPIFSPEAQKGQAEQELSILEEKIRQGEAIRIQREGDIATLRQERGKLQAALATSGQTLQSLERQLAATNQRLTKAQEQEEALRRSLNGREAQMAHVLGILQRVGRTPPAPLLTEPHDMMKALRATLLLSSVIMPLQGEVAALAQDIRRFAEIRDTIKNEDITLNREQHLIAREQERLDALIRARSEEIAASTTSLVREREKAVQNAERSTTLRALITRIEREIETARKAQESAEKALAHSRAEEAKRSRERLARAFGMNPTRLAPERPFERLRGQILYPVVGQRLRAFDEPDGLGGVMKGITFAPLPRARILAPADGWVVFAGSFRSYGRLLILNAGGGYYLLLAGMQTLAVEPGQFVLAGEPVGMMGETLSPSSVLGALDTDKPVLYVEFRKDGHSIDPAPWWTGPVSEKVRG
jgi:murein hydrolase activator